MHILNMAFNLIQFPGRVRAIQILSLVLLMACEAEEPTREDSPEMITTVTVTFTPADGGEPIIGNAIDPDADGIRDIETEGPVELMAGTTYVLTLGLYNDLADQDSDEYNIASEVEEEGAEHMLFFEWTGGIFSEPSGDGNLDNRDGPVHYEDADINGLPLGLETRWTTASPSAGTLRIVLKHQPDLKSETSTSDMGETDLDVRFDLIVQ